MIFKKFDKSTEFRSEPGVAAIAEKSAPSRARISDRRAGVPPGARSGLEQHASALACMKEMREMEKIEVI